MIAQVKYLLFAIAVGLLQPHDSHAWQKSLPDASQDLASDLKAKMLGEESGQSTTSENNVYSILGVKLTLHLRQASQSILRG